MLPQLLTALFFALLGDVPYSQPQANLLDDMIERINAEAPAFVVHVGDITSGRGPCSDEWFEARKQQFARFKAPFVLLPGDNEWLDCRRRTGFDPMERLEKWRQLFCHEIPLDNFQRQKNKYCENVRWIAGNVVFVGVHVTGDNNNSRDPLETGERMQAVFKWLDEAEALARERDGLVILMHANPFLRHQGYATIRERLRRLGASMPGKVLLVNGDTHSFRDDEPLPGLRRTEVYGWPWLRWTKARIENNGAKRFVLEAAE
jgi:hypothetical protein